jgi:symplekin
VASEAFKFDESELEIKTFKLQPPPLLTYESAINAGRQTVAEIFEHMKMLEEPPAKKQKVGINRLAARSNDRESWITIITRLATRASAGLEDVTPKSEDSTGHGGPVLGNIIREGLYTYILEDFRKRIDMAVSWLCEEWYNDQIQKRAGRDAPIHYEKWALKLIDGFLPYLHPQDKVLTRFLAEIPELNSAILARVKHMCRDPSVVPLALTSLLYLVMMRPPVKELALDTVQNIWTECKSILLVSIPARY